MFARVAMYHGADADSIDRLVAGTQELEGRLDDPSGDLDGLREFVLLVDRESGRGLVLSLFDSEEALQRGDARLNRESLSQAGGVRTGVEYYEVAMHRTRA